MNFRRFRSAAVTPPVCARIRGEFSAYLNSEISGRSMAVIAEHLESCAACGEEFAGWRRMVDSLSNAGRVSAPAQLQVWLREALHRERLAESHLTAAARLRAVWRRTFTPLWRDTLAPLAVRVSAGLVIAASLLGGLTWMFAGPLAVEANDDNLAHLSAPIYLYSQVPTQPIITRNDAPILIEAKVNEQGRIYDFSFVDAPQDPAVRLRIEQDLLASVFRPATLFGTPVRGHVMLTFNGVSVRG